jgi:HAD superfamily hydrolase (TIGR01549 family)
LRAADSRDRGLLLDLFGTIVFFDASRLRTVHIAGAQRPSTLDPSDELVASLASRVSMDALWTTLREVSLAFERETQTTLAEMSSKERFRRALVALDVGSDVDALADGLSRRHMRGLSTAVVCPADRVALLDRLATRYRLALVSNFDHTETAHALLKRDGLWDRFDAVVVSEEVGLRKPHRRLFELACERIGLPPDACVHVGDSHRADIHGAAGVGMRSVWIDAGDAPIEPAAGRISDLRELPDWLASRPD